LIFVYILDSHFWIFSITSSFTRSINLIDILLIVSSFLSMLYRRMPGMILSWAVGVIGFDWLWSRWLGRHYLSMLFRISLWQSLCRNVAFWHVSFFCCAYFVAARFYIVIFKFCFGLSFVYNLNSLLSVSAPLAEWTRFLERVSWNSWSCSRYYTCRPFWLSRLS